MPKFNVAVDHELQRDDVIERLKLFAIEAKAQASTIVTEVEEVWDSDGNLQFSFKAMGISVSGQVVACSESITVKGNLPFAALPFRGAIESQIRDRIQQAIG